MFAFKATLVVVAASFVAACQCAYLAAPAPVAVAAPVPVAVSTGVSAQTRSQDSLGNYRFAYDIIDHLGARNGRSESGDALGNKVGSYSIADIDGRVRRVDYIADGAGFRASIQTNEHGTAPSNTAAASYSPPLVAAAVPVPVAAPVAVAAPAYPVAAPAIIDSMAKLLAPGVPAYGASPLYGFARKA